MDVDIQLANGDEFPSEILIKVLACLNVRDLVRCRLVNRRFKHLIGTSLLLRYKIELGILCLVDSPEGQLPTHDRYNRLRLHQRAWNTLRWEARASIPLNLQPGFGSEIAGGMFVSAMKRNVAGNKTTEMGVWRMPAIIGEEELRAAGVPEKWAFDLGIDIDGFAVDVEQNLLVLIQALQPNERNVLPIRIYLRTLSNNLPHPAAVHAMLEYPCDTGWPNYTFIPQVMGTQLGVLCASGVLGDSNFDRFVLWDWTRGIMQGMVATQNSRYDAFCFISDRVLIMPCANGATLKLFTFTPSRDSDGSPPSSPLQGLSHAASFHLPNLQQQARYISITCRSSPSPIRGAPLSGWGLPRARKEFETAPEEGIIGLSVHLFVHGNRSRDFTILTHRKTLLDLIPEDPAEFPRRVPWEVWGGPESTRWVVDPRPPRSARSVHGTRFVQLISPPTNPWEGQIRVLDFNQLALRRGELQTYAYHLPKEVRIVTEKTVIPAEDFFEEDVVSSLPYYEVTSVNSFQFSRVLLDDERIIGMKPDGPGSQTVVQLDVLVM